jgi:NAD-dependent deacetylase
VVIDPINEGRRLVGDASSVVVITGAGISTASGIQDFRGPEGLWTKNPAAERLSSIDAYLGSPDVRSAAWRSALRHREFAAQPNSAHRALAAFEATGKLTALITQNIDGLHVAAGSSEALVIEVHGNPRMTRCLSCGTETPTSAVLERVSAGNFDPHCTNQVRGVPCGGILKTTVVSFGESLPRQDFARAEFLAKTCDVLICIGSTLMVRPVSSLVPKATSRGARLVIVNADSTPFDDEADVIVRGDIVTVLGPLMGVIDS